MDTYLIKNSDDVPFAFEIDNIYIGAKKIAALLGKVDGVSEIRLRKMFSLPDDIHIEFKYAGEDFMVLEPYADSSRYWIGPKDDKNRNIPISVIEAVFKEYQPSPAIKLIGDLLSLNIFSR